ncbi:hypothetical protein [Streptomyces sp. NPDC048172]|uniref:hypothetical protein n=1 Tax=Streptomyces sp. NPDC048172 TaxID=3365505 RepID=UPI003718BDB4
MGVGAAGAALALVDIDSVLRAPLTLFFLVAAPAGALAALLPRLDPLSRTVVAVTGALAVDLLVGQAMVALHLWSARGGVAAVAVLSTALLLLSLARGRTARGRERQRERQEA